MWMIEVGKVYIEKEIGGRVAKRLLYTPYNPSWLMLSHRFSTEYMTYPSFQVVQNA